MPVDSCKYSVQMKCEAELIHRNTEFQDIYSIGYFILKFFSSVLDSEIKSFLTNYNVNKV